MVTWLQSQLPRERDEEAERERGQTDVKTGRNTCTQIYRHARRYGPPTHTHIHKDRHPDR